MNRSSAQASSAYADAGESLVFISVSTEHNPDYKFQFQKFLHFITGIIHIKNKMLPLEK